MICIGGDCHEALSWDGDTHKHIMSSCPETALTEAMNDQVCVAWKRLLILGFVNDDKKDSLILPNCMCALVCAGLHAIFCALYMRVLVCLPWEYVRMRFD
jgi:hypothetical protein